MKYWNRSPASCTVDGPKSFLKWNLGSLLPSICYILIVTAGYSCFLFPHIKCLVTRVISSSVPYVTGPVTLFGETVPPTCRALSHAKHVSGLISRHIRPFNLVISHEATLCQLWNSAIWCTTSQGRNVLRLTWAKLVDISLHLWKNTKAPSHDTMNILYSPHIAWRPATHWIGIERLPSEKGRPSIHAILSRPRTQPVAFVANPVIT